ncbi:MAG: Kelch repeat-containing protein, partial [Planctomycetota bacterium]
MKRWLPSFLVLASLLSARASATAGLEFSNGIVGENATLALSGTPSPFLLLLSTNQGPTPLSLIDPSDPRVLNVGIDLLGLAISGLVPSSLVVPLANDPALVGAVLYAQYVTFPGPGTLVNEISNSVAVVLTAHGATLPALGLLAEGRALATATRLPNGNLLVAGGGSGGITGATGLSSAEVYSRHLRTFSTVPGGMTIARAFHTATALGTGLVLLAGGATATGPPTATAELYNPATNAFTATASMGVARAGHTATLLPNGNVLVTGGVSVLDSADLLATIASTQLTTVIYNPGTGLWSAGPNMSSRRAGHTATRMNNGQVLVVGGVTVTFLFGFPIPSFSGTAQRYDSGTGGFVGTASLPVAQERALHGASPLLSGEALVAGGLNGDLITQTFNVLGSAYRYNPATNTWASAGSMANPRTQHAQVVLPDGRVVVLGGAQGTLTTPVPIASIELWTPATGLWTSSGALLVPRASLTAALTPDDKHVVAI